MTRNKNQQAPSQTSQTKLNKQRSDLTFLEHLYELRSRLFWVVLTLIITSAIGFQYKDLLVDIIMAPLHGEQLVYLTPGGGFSFIFTLCLYFGALLAIPVVVYHIYRFLQPMLQHTSRRFVAIFIGLSSLLAITGTLFGYFVAIPSALTFLTTFAGDTVTPNLTADSYLGFVVAYVLGLAALFQIPLLLFLFDHIRPIPPGGLSSSQRFVIIGASVAAAIITPTPDVMNMAIIAVPIIVVYEVGAFVVFLRHQLNKRKTRRLSAGAIQRERAHQKALRLRQSLQNQQSDFEPKPKLAPVQQPTAALPVAPAITKQRPRRTMDGFVIGSRPAPMAATIPAQPKSRRVVVPTAHVQPVRSIRSLDGFSRI